MSEQSSVYSSVCIPGVQVAEVRQVLGERAVRVGMRAFSYGTELRAPNAVLRDVLGGLAGDGIYTGLFCTADEYERAVFEHLLSAGAIIVTAESCTAGIVAASLTEMPGSSSLLWGGYVVYANEAKVRLGVSPQVLESFGAVSGETVKALVQASLSKSNANMAVAVSGIAGPDGGTKQKPVGTVWVAAGVRNGNVRSRYCLFEGTRGDVRSLSAGACHGALLSEASELTRGY